MLAELAWRMDAAINPAAWVIDDVSFPKDGQESPGVAAQYCGALGKTANCQVAPSVHLVTDAASCPVNWRLFMPEGWDVSSPRVADTDAVMARRRRARIPDDVAHVPKWRLAVDMLDELACWGLDAPLVVADEGYGQDGAFRLALTERNIAYVVGVRSDTALLTAEVCRTSPPYRGTGRPPVPRYRQQRISARQMVMAAGRGALRTVTWRAGSKGPLRSRFVALRVRPAGIQMRRAHVGGDLPVCWLLAEWPVGEPKPTKYWLSTFAAEVPLRHLVRMAKIRWRIEHDYKSKPVWVWIISRAAPGAAGIATSPWSRSPTRFAPLSGSTQKCRLRSEYLPGHRRAAITAGLLGRALPHLPPSVTPTRPACPHLTKSY